MTRLRVHTDGASKGNPGRAGIGVVLFDHKDHIIDEIGESIGITTNNIAEYTAFILGLIEALGRGERDVVMYLDSELVVKQLKGIYRVKDDKLKPLFVIAKRLMAKFSNIEIHHVPRERNKDADRLANRALD